MLNGLYVITDPHLTPGDQLIPAVAAALAGGAALVQYRAKHMAATTRQTQACALQQLCQRAGAKLIINDDVALALAVGAAGVHLGQADASIATARSCLGPQAIIGASCYADLSRAEAAWAAGANYLAFGSVYPSPTKPQAPRADPKLLGIARGRFGLPIAAIGGITRNNAAEVRAAGADLLAVISGVFAAADIQTASHHLSMLCSIPLPP